jgi:RND family efflux transporter MFP subunit
MRRSFDDLKYWVAFAYLALAALGLGACSGSSHADQEGPGATTVGVVRVQSKPLQRQLTVSSELVPFQEIDVYAKESGFVQKLYVDYGSRVKQGQVMATLEIPELEASLQQDEAEIKADKNEVERAEHEVKRYQAQYSALHLEYTRLDSVFKSQPGLVAQQEVDDAQGKDLAAASQVDAGESLLDSVKSKLAAAQAKLVHDQALFAYSRITAPFSGVVTDRYANLGTLMQSGTSSSTQALPLVKLSEDDHFRLVIPVPEGYVRFIKIGDPVQVRVPSLNRLFPGKVARFSVDVREDTRTMHTEVDVYNKDRVLVPGLYAEATLTLERSDRALSVPLQAVSHQGNKVSVFVIGPDKQIVIRPVTLGIQTPNEAEILSGLSEGDLVVVSDRSALKAGEKVQTHEVRGLQYEEEEGNQQ